MRGQVTLGNSGGMPLTARKKARGGASRGESTASDVSQESGDEPVASPLDRSEVRGFVTLLGLCAAFFSLFMFELNISRQGIALDLKLFWLMLRDSTWLFIVDFGLVLYSFSAPLASLLLQKGFVGRRLFCMMQISLELCLFVFTGMWVCYRNWPWPQALFITMHTCVIAMKMHAFMTTNLALYTDYIAFIAPHSRKELASQQSTADCKAAEKPSGYPENLTIANFIDFLLLPVLVYQTHYARTKEFVIRVSPKHYCFLISM